MRFLRMFCKAIINLMKLKDKIYQVCIFWNHFSVFWFLPGRFPFFRVFKIPNLLIRFQNLLIQFKNLLIWFRNLLILFWLSQLDQGDVAAVVIGVNERSQLGQDVFGHKRADAIFVAFVVVGIWRKMIQIILQMFNSCICVF